MTFKPAVWRPITIVLSAANVIAVWFAAIPAEPLHATSHAALAVAFALWAQRLRQTPPHEELDAGLEAVEIEMDQLRQELGAAEERLDFAERMLAQEREPRREGLDR